MIKKASKMDWLKNKVNQTLPGKSTSIPNSSELKYQRVHRFDQCNYVFNDGTVQRQFTSYINDIKKLVFSGDTDNCEMNASQSCIREACDVLRSMSSLISSQSSISELASDLSDIMCTEKLVKILLSWTKFCHQQDELVDRLMSEQFILYDLFLAQSNQQFLIESEHLQPLLELLNLCSLKLQNDLIDNSKLEEKFLFTLHQICISVTIQSEVLDMIFEGSSSEDKFSVFNLLIPFVHREGVIGQQARDALLLIMSLSAKNDKIGLFVANESNFCPVLATGLSGLYSSLPCKLEYPSDDWHHLSDEDLLHIPDLRLFLNSLEFCNAVIQASHPAVCSKLLEFIMDGFLQPVVGPALNQDLLKHPAKFHDLMLLTTIEEVVAATAYLDLFIRKITEPSLLKIFVDFILLGKVDEVPIIDILVARISSQLTRLCVITLMLFYSLVDLNCEDVMFHLVFKHILSGKHIMLSQHHSVKEIDFYATDAGRFLSTIPKCCHLYRDDDPSVETTSETSFSSVDEGRPSSKIGRLNFKSKKSSNLFSPLSPLLKGHRSPRPETSSHGIPTSSEETSYGDYLTRARCMISTCKESCKNWSFKYDSIRSPLVGERKLLPHDSVSDLNIDRGKSEPEETSNEDDDFISDAQTDDVAEEHDDLASFLSRLNEFEVSIQVSGQSALPDLLKEIDRLYGQTFCPRNKPKIAKEEVDVQEQTSEISTSLNLLDDLTSTSDRPSLGPFLEALFNRVERMAQSTLYVNLQLTSLVARLSCYPQPLLRSLLLSHSLIYQPSVKSFLQVLNSVKKKLEEYLSNLPQREAYLCQAYQFLNYRMSPDVNLMPFEVFKNADGRRRSSGFHEIFRSNHKQRQQRLVISNSSAQYVHHLPGGEKEEENESIERKNAIYAAITFKEFLKELAAISQEHVVICLS